VYKIAEISVIIIICIHWAACLEYYLPLAVAKIVGQNDALVIDRIALCFERNI